MRTLINKGQAIKSRENNNQALKFVKKLLLIGLSAILFYASKSLFWDKANDPIINAISIFSLMILIAGSALTAGGFAGFIFAIPRAISNTDQTNTPMSLNDQKQLEGDKIEYAGNDNLVQISDWLTKIIVGVGLTKLSNIPGAIQSLGKYIGPAIGGQIWGEIGGESAVIYFSICGFLLAYLWTRLYFGDMLENAE